ncbi:MAG: TetR/AcrR family transcriptional regulator [Treponemataceae bacterium]
MKATFYNLDEDKRRRIETAAMEEFGTYGYERGSTDRIIRKSGISKGGLYEYIESKEDLFLHVVEIAYGALYDHITSGIRLGGGPPPDILKRVMAASSAALGFYLENPLNVRLIASLATINDPDAKAKAERVFGDQFLKLFGDSDFSKVRFEKKQVLELLRWLLVKTRNDFISELESCDDSAEVSKAYLADWEFILSVLSDGIYSKRGNPCSD